MPGDGAIAPKRPATPLSRGRWSIPPAGVIVGSCYLAASAGFAAWWLAGQCLLWRLARSARPVPGAVRGVFDDLAGPGGRRVALLESDRIALPITFTWARPVILLPSSLCDGGELGALRYVLAHEWSHVERGDAWAWNFACLSGFVLFYQPLFWWLRRQLRLCQDYLADARAAAAGSSEDYAAYLVCLARRHRSGPALPALGIGDRRSNLYRRVTMLVDDREPLEQRCRTAWSAAITAIAAAVIVFASGVRLGAAQSVAVEATKEAQAVKDAAKPSPDAKDAEGPLRYKGTVVDKDSGQPIPGATVVVRRSILRANDNRMIQETSHTTAADGTYAFGIPPDQFSMPYLYIELDVEHPDYATRDRFGYSLSMIRKNETLNERPFFETVELRPAKPITGRVETPEGRPAEGVVVLAYSRSDKGGFAEYGSFVRAETDAQGRYRLPITTPGQAAYWVLPRDHAVELHVVPGGKRGDMGTITLKKGVSVAGRVVDVQGKPIVGVFVEIERKPGGESDLDANGLSFISNVIRRVAETDADGRFTFAPLPSGEYTATPSESNYDGDRKSRWDRRPLDHVFAPVKLTIKEGEAAEPLEIRASPVAVIEGRWLDSKGQPKGGWSSSVFGRIDGSFWHAMTNPDVQGRFSLKVPHGLEQVELDISTNEHASARYRIGKDGPLSEGRRVNLGTLDHDVKGIEIVRYVAPIVVVDATTGDGKQIQGFRATAKYTDPGTDPDQRLHLTGGGKKKDALQDEQYDGRYRTSSLLPDREVEIGVSADGFAPASRKFTLPEGKTEEVTFVLEPK
ncbi:carboxypeptidase regulatory-like domain-containing protein [Tundrisphaera sp. TA3]|uniref:carboxypeptidase regulatory-like domain-containing protein n=1 Tax=Tundrisphaera sp. TA3 TaxID=3435775 RepID=UPI003EB863E7